MKEMSVNQMGENCMTLFVRYLKLTCVLGYKKNQTFKSTENRSLKIISSF